MNAAGLCSGTCSYTPTSRSETEEQSEAGNAGSHPPIDGMPPAKFKVLYILASLSRDFYLELFFPSFPFFFFVFPLFLSAFSNDSIMKIDYWNNKNAQQNDKIHK